MGPPGVAGRAQGEPRCCIREQLRARGQASSSRGSDEGTFALPRSICAAKIDYVDQATLANPKKYPLDDMYEAAQEIIKDVKSDPKAPDGMDPGFISSFWIYPLAQAYSYVAFLARVRHNLISFNHSVVAIYYRQLAKLHRNEPELFAKYMEQSAEMYLQAATEYPPDDEFHTCASSPPPPVLPYLNIVCVVCVQPTYSERSR